jgi:16S rRNA processing protein RimM
VAAPPPTINKIAPIDPDYVIIAQVSAPFGLRGGVKAEIRSDFPDRFERLKEVYLAPPQAAPGAPHQLYKVMNARLQNEKQVVFRFEGLTKVEQAEPLRGYTISVPREEVIPLPDGEYYIFQLIGLEVYSDTDIYVGQVINVLQYPANDVYEVKGPLAPKPILIPAIKQVVLEIDLEQQRITINLMDGLID